MKKIIITGALGHIGSKLTETLALYNKNFEIIIIDNKLPKQDSSCKFIKADILDYDLDSLFEDTYCVIHLAALTNATQSFKNNIEVENVNHNGTKKVINSCIKNRCKLVFISTTSVYATHNKIIDENCIKDELKPQSPYAISKLKSEYELEKYSNNLDYIILRFATIVGFSKRMKFHTVVSKFCLQAVMKQPLTVWETALEQRRPYLDLEDAVSAIIFVIKHNIFNNEIYNILTKNAKVSDIIGYIKKNIDNIDISFVKVDIMNQLSYYVSNEKFKSLGFEFKGDIENSIKDIIKNLKDEIANGLFKDHYKL